MPSAKLSSRKSAQDKFIEVGNSSWEYRAVYDKSLAKTFGKTSSNLDKNWLDKRRNGIKDSYGEPPKWRSWRRIEGNDAL